MPTIHIHTDDADMIGAIVAYCLAYGPADIHIDRDDDGLHVQHVVVAPPTNLVDDIMAYEADRLAHRRAMRDERRKADMANYHDYLTMTCPTCLASYDRPCHTVASGKPLAPHTVHGTRRRAYYAHDEVWGAVEAVPAVPQTCQCGHDDVVHFVPFDPRDETSPCGIDACSCERFVAVEPIFHPITLDEM